MYILRMRLKNTYSYDASRGTDTNYLARMLSGEGRFVSLDGEEITVRPGDIFFLPLGLQYRSYWKGGEIGWNSFAFTLFPHSIGKYPMQVIDSDDSVRDMLDELAGYDEFSCAALGLLYTALGRLLPNMRLEDPDNVSLVTKASEYLDRNPKATVAQAARYCNVSESSLFAAYRAVGTTPVKMRLKHQLDSALKYIQATDLNLDEVAERCGFCSASHMLHMLKRETGMTSKDIRRQS